MKDVLKRFILLDIDPNTVRAKGYDYFKLPGSSEFFRGPKKDDFIIQLSLQRLYYLYTKLKLKYQKKQRFPITVILIDGQDLFNSQVIIFFDKKAFTSFFKRKSKNQTWVKIHKKNPIIRRYKLENYKSMKEICYKEVYKDTELNKVYVNYLWFYL